VHQSPSPTAQLVAAALLIEARKMTVVVKAPTGPFARLSIAVVPFLSRWPQVIVVTFVRSADLLVQHNAFFAASIAPGTAASATRSRQ